MTKKFKALLAGSALAIIATPVLADVKSGVDAWERGDFSAAVREWRPLAIKGDADAQFNLAQAYRFGRGVPADMKMAEQWYRKAAMQGHMQAEDNLGLILFQNGDVQNAMPLIERSANRGEPRAQYVLGTALFNGDFVQKDWPRAYGYMTRASAAGMSKASSALAQMDRYIPLEQRQSGLQIASQLEANAGRPQMGQPMPVAAKPAQPVQAVAQAPVQPAWNNRQAAPAPAISDDADERPVVVGSSTPAPPVRAQTAPSMRGGALPSPRTSSKSRKSRKSGKDDQEMSDLPADTGYPVQGDASAGGYPSDGAYPSQYPSQSGYPAQGGYPSQGAYPAQGAYPTQGGNPSQGGYPADAGAYPADSEAYPAAPVPARPQTRPAPPKRAVAPARPAAPAATGGWRIQLGAFQNATGAQNLWQSLKGRLSVLAGKQPYLVKAGSVTRLQAGGYSSRAAAESACASVRASGNSCMVVGN